MAAPPQPFPTPVLRVLKQEQREWVSSGGAGIYGPISLNAGLIGPPTAPTNVDVPVITQAQAVLTCTKGNWTGAPDFYAYQWKLDGTNAGTNSPTYTAVVGDVGKSATCVVTGTNGAGSTAAPPTTAHVITSITTLEAPHGTSPVHRQTDDRSKPAAREADKPQHRPGATGVHPGKPANGKSPTR